MSSLDKLFANSIKNDITSSFVESVEAIMSLETISTEDFLRRNKVKVYTPSIKEDFSFFKPKKLTFTDSYSYQETEYDILSVWLYKLSENLRRIYSAKKQSNNYSSLIEQQNNLYTISNQFLDYWDTSNEGAFFPRAIFGRHADYLEPLNFLIYLGFHDCLTQENFYCHLKLVEKFSPKFDFSDLPDFIPKLALSSQNSKLLKTILPLIPQDSLLNTLNYSKSSDGFKIISFEYLFENYEHFNFTNYQKVNLIENFLRDDVLLSRHFDDFILDKSVFLNNLSKFITPEVSKGIEIIFVHKSSKLSQYKSLESVFLNERKKSSPTSLLKELQTLTFEEIQESYDLSSSLISKTIDKILESSVLKENQYKDYYFYQFKNFVEKLHPVLEKEHLAKIISLNSDFLSFCKPVYLRIRIQEKLADQFKPVNVSNKKPKI